MKAPFILLTVVCAVVACGPTNNRCTVASCKTGCCGHRHVLYPQNCMTDLVGEVH